MVQGGPDVIVNRVRAHLDAGADHVCIQLRSSEANQPFLEDYQALALALAELTDT